MKSLLKKILLGYTIPNEYVCLAGKLNQPLRVMLSTPNQTASEDVTNHHIFLGYKPLVIGLTAQIGSSLHAYLSGAKKYSLTFEFSANGHEPERLARVFLHKLVSKKLDDREIFLCEGTHGWHRFLNPFHQRMHQVWSLLNHKPGNVDLEQNLYSQVIAAYSVPRNISIITVGDDRSINVFPTDLHGSISESFYAGSLRHEGKACQQVERYGKIVLSAIDASWFKEAYQLGKNHMRETRTAADFDFLRGRSEQIGLPLPESAIRYKELIRLESMDFGIHRIHFYKVVNEKIVSDKPALSHIHRYYLQWRIDHHLHTDINLR